MLLYALALKIEQRILLLFQLLEMHILFDKYVLWLYHKIMQLMFTVTLINNTRENVYK